MKRLIVIFLSSLFLMGILFQIQAQVPLCPGDCDKMKPEALAYYEQALMEFDRVNPKGALEQLRLAAAADPDHINLHFFLARLARKRGKIETNLEEAQKYYTIAENTLLHIQEKENLTRDQQPYLQNALEMVQKEKAALIQRNKRRMSVGYSIILDHMKEIGKFQQEKKEEEGQETGADTAAAPASTVSSSSPFGSPISTSSPFGAPVVTQPASGSSSPFGAPVAAPAPSSSPFGAPAAAPAPAASSASPFGSPGATETAPTIPAPATTVENPFETP